MTWLHGHPRDQPTCEPLTLRGAGRQGIISTLDFCDYTQKRIFICWYYSLINQYQYLVWEISSLVTFCSTLHWPADHSWWSRVGVSLHVDAPEVWTRLWCWSVGMILMMTSCNNIGDEFLRRLTPDNWSRAVRLSWEEISLMSSELSSHWLLNRFPVPYRNTHFEGSPWRNYLFWVHCAFVVRGWTIFV